MQGMEGRQRRDESGREGLRAERRGRGVGGGGCCSFARTVDCGQHSPRGERGVMQIVPSQNEEQRTPTLSDLAAGIAAVATPLRRAACIIHGRRPEERGRNLNAGYRRTTGLTAVIRIKKNSSVYQVLFRCRL